MKLFLILFTFLILTGCAEPVAAEDVNEEKYENIIEQKIVDYKGFQSEVQRNDDILYVVNFWATWCVPCVEELPHFIEINEQYKGEKFNMTFVTLDGAKDFEKRVLPFAKEYNMNADLFLLDDVKNMNTWIKATDSEWSGAIPATIIYKNGKKLHFTEGQLSKSELETLIKQYL